MGKRAAVLPRAFSTHVANCLHADYSHTQGTLMSLYAFCCMNGFTCVCLYVFGKLRICICRVCFLFEKFRRVYTVGSRRVQFVCAAKSLYGVSFMS